MAELIRDTPKVAFDHYGREWEQHYHKPTDDTPWQPAAGPPIIELSALLAVADWLDADELERLRQLLRLSRLGAKHYPSGLTRPKPRPGTETP